MEKSPQINELSETDGLGKPTTPSVRGIYASPSARLNISPPMQRFGLKDTSVSETI